jgi:FtsZ-interacting cell division protein ZipA
MDAIAWVIVVLAVAFVASIVAEIWLARRRGRAAHWRAAVLQRARARRPRR